MPAQPWNATIPIDRITVNLARLVRAGIDPEFVDEYARLDKEGVELPRVRVFKKEDTSPVEYILVDGDTRVEALKKNKKTDIQVTVYEGSAGDALLAAAAANADHGRPRSAADKRKAIRLVLEQPEHAKKTSRQIAALCGGLSHHLVEEVRADMGGKDDERTDKRGRKVKAKKRKKSAVLFDFSVIEKEIGHVAKSIDDVLEVYPDEAKKGDHRLVKQAADKLFELWTGWSKTILQVNK